ncbi:DUF3313 domain-containing protein [Pseudomonas sp. GD04042]|uniref:DUF3313 domain-containing protein n=1 Tax=Pseudomonas sp. GD04042 TaxID=2975425 RepID=UPI002446BA18|nr:DUF3313 domain-containing protein [Pseudomonas sp. GD04042]MDG9928121.1 DUF3313 domain-containing protein [Pseudomonas sp. GD04042]
MRHANPLCLGLLAGVLLAGCASQTTQPSQYSGFLADYSQLRPTTSASGAPVLRWVSPDFKDADYRSVYVEQPVFHPAPKPSDQVSQDTLDRVADYLRQAIAREVSQRMPVVDTPDRDSLVLRSAITGVDVSAEGLHAYEVIPIALVLAAANTAAGTRDRDTVIYVEMEAVAARDGQPMVRVVRKGHGLQLENSDTRLTLDDLKPALDIWARDARSFKP